MIQRLKKIKPQWDEVFASLGDGLVILDTDKRLIGINPAAEKMTGFSAETVLGHSLEEAFAGNGDVLTMLQPSFTEGRTWTLREVPWKGRQEETAIVDLSATPLIGDGDQLGGWILVFRDITPVKELEEQVRKADRLAMMGTIAAGLAHEIKNPLSGIKGSAQLLARENLSPGLKECTQIIIKESERVDRLITQLLTFARPKTLILKPINPNELLDSILLLQTEVLKNKKIHLVREYDPSLPFISGDGEQLTQVFLNFIKNAIESTEEFDTPKGGEIRIRTRMTDFRIREKSGRKASRMIMVEIRDNGVGIPQEILENIFTPFFTTKEKGSGLGLAIAQRIIQEHEGSIRVFSKKSQGATFQIYLRSYYS